MYTFVSKSIYIYIRQKFDFTMFYVNLLPQSFQCATWRVALESSGTQFHSFEERNSHPTTGQGTPIEEDPLNKTSFVVHLHLGYLGWPSHMRTMVLESTILQKWVILMGFSELDVCIPFIPWVTSRPAARCHCNDCHGGALGLARRGSSEVAEGELMCTISWVVPQIQQHYVPMKITNIIAIL